MADKWRNVRVFVSSTFRDMHAERDHLVRAVFPELKKLCRERQVYLTDVDLRWGVSEKDAQDGKALDICLNEIDTCRPYFLGLLGHRYGWIPLPTLVEPHYAQALDPKSIPGILFQQAYLPNPDGSFSLISDERMDLSWGDQRENNRLILAAALETIGVPGAGQSITAAEIFHGVLHNDIPRQVVDLPAIIEGRLEGRRLSEEQVACLSRSYQWDGEKRKYVLGQELSQVDADIIRSVFREYAAYQRDRSFFFFRSERLSKELAGSNQADFFETDSTTRGRLVALKEEVKSQGLTWFEYDDLESFGSQVRDKLWQRIQAQIGQGPTVERDWLKIERDFHHIFATDRTRRFVGRRAYLDRMQVFCEGEGSGGSLLVVKGMPGCGKTALMARFSEEMQRRHPDWLIVPHFVGASPDSTNLRRTLRRFHGEMNRYAGLEEEIPEDIRDLHNRFSEKLQKASEKDRVLFVLDAVNQMEHSDNPQEMTWLPFNLPKNVCFVISSLEGESLDALQARKPVEVEARGLDPREIESLVDKFLADVRKSFPNPQTRYAFLAKLQHGSPLYITVALEELRIFGVFAQLGRRISDLPTDIPTLFQQVLERVEADFAAWPGLVAEALSLIACSRQGMTSEEMQTLLARHAPAFSDGSRPDRLPDMLWSRLQLSLDAYLFERSGAVDFFHGQLKQAVGARWLKEKEVRVQNHQLIAYYFRNRWAEPYLRALDELPHQELKCEDWIGLTKTLCNLEFIRQKCAAGLFYEMLTDFQNTLASLPENQEIFQREKSNNARLQKYTENLLGYAKTNFSKLEIISAVKPSGKGQYIEERERILEEPNRLDEINAFFQFFKSECHHFIRHGAAPTFFYSHAYNYCDTGPVASAVEEIIYSSGLCPFLLRYLLWRPPYNPHPACLITLEGHTDFVSTVAITADGRRAVSGSGDKTLRIWDLELGRCKKILQGHTLAVTSVALTVDGNTAVSGSSDNTLRVWEVETGRCLRILTGHKKGVTDIALTADGRIAVSGSEDRTFKQWEIETGRCIRTFTGATDSITAVDLTPDGKTAVWAGAEGITWICDLETSIQPRILRNEKEINKSDSFNHSVHIHGLSISADAKSILFVTGSSGYLIRDIDTDEGGYLQDETIGYYAGAITPDGKFAVTAGDYGTISLWGEEFNLFEGHADKLTSIALTADGRLAVSGSHDKTVKVWDLERGQCLRIFELDHYSSGHADAYTLIDENCLSNFYHQDHKLLLLSDFWKIHKLSHRDMDQGKKIYGNCIVLSSTPNGDNALIGTDHKFLYQYNLFNRNLMVTHGYWSHQFVHLHTEPTSFTISPDGTYALTPIGKDILLWEQKLNRYLCDLIGHTAAVNVVKWTSDAKFAISASKDNSIRVWKFIWENSQVDHHLVLNGHTKSVTTLSISSDDRILVSGSDDRTIRIWELTTGDCLRILKGHSGKVTAVSQSADSRILISASGDKTIRVWDLNKGICKLILAGHTKSVAAVKFINNETRLVSKSDDKSHRVWDIETGQCLFTINEYCLPNCEITVSANGRWLIVESHGNSVKIYDLENGWFSIMETFVSGIRLLSVTENTVMICLSNNHIEALQLIDTTNNANIKRPNGFEVEFHQHEKQYYVQCYACHKLEPVSDILVNMLRSNRCDKNLLNYYINNSDMSYRCARCYRVLNFNLDKLYSIINNSTHILENKAVDTIQPKLPKDNSDELYNQNIKNNELKKIADKQSLATFLDAIRSEIDLPKKYKISKCEKMASRANEINQLKVKYHDDVIEIRNILAKISIAWLLITVGIAIGIDGEILQKISVAPVFALITIYPFICVQFWTILRQALFQKEIKYILPCYILISIIAVPATFYILSLTFSYIDYLWISIFEVQFRSDEILLLSKVATILLVFSCIELYPILAYKNLTVLHFAIFGYLLMINFIMTLIPSFVFFCFLLIIELTICIFFIKIYKFWKRPR